jgi:hypothetical protein
MDQMTRRRKTRALVVPRVKYNRLRKWFERDPQPMSLKQFAVELGVTPSYVSQLCRDDPPWPKRHIARKIGIITRGYVTPNHLAGFSGWDVWPSHDNKDD